VPVDAELPKPVENIHPPIQSHEEPPEPKLPPVRDAAKLVAETNGKLLDIFFAYDRSDLSPDALAAAERDARLLTPLLADFPGVRLAVEGHCDERGSAEYNIALGDRRAGQAAAVLRDLGVPAARIDTLSYGKERPQCDEPNESCWRRNRRAHLLLSLAGTTATMP
jgi:peptidoglycan-associated lipoprotein